MLVLKRKPGQHIMIGDRIVVTVVRVEGSTVRLGITAPDDVQIYRDDAKKVHRRRLRLVGEVDEIGTPGDWPVVFPPEVDPIG